MGELQNLSSLKKIVEKPKFIILYRPLVECVCSFAKLQIEDNNYTKENIYDYVLQMMNFENGILGKSIWSITNLIKEKRRLQDILLQGFSRKY